MINRQDEHSASMLADDGAIQRERDYWEAYEDLDWADHASKQAVFACIPQLEGDILELCIGAGTFTRALPRCYASYTGLDLSQSLLNALRKHMPDVKTIHGNAQKLPLPDESYNRVLVFSGLHHLPQYERCLAESYRVLRPGGYFFCFEPNDTAWYRAPMRLLRDQKFVRDFIKIYSEDEVYLAPHTVSQVLSHCGFLDVRVNYLTPRFRPGYLSLANRLFAHMMYSAAALGRSAGTQSYFAISAQKPLDDHREPAEKPAAAKSFHPGT